MIARVASGRLALRNVVARPVGASRAQCILANTAAREATHPANKGRLCFSSAACHQDSVEEKHLLNEVYTKHYRHHDAVPNEDDIVQEAENEPDAASNKIHPPLSSLLPVNTSHTSLATFISHARHARLNPTTYTFLGTRYEYLAQEILTRVGFELVRTGKAGDRGVDLAGWWHLPSSRNDGNGGQERLRVLVQCKRIKGQRKVTPSVVREMDGAFLGAPAGWRSDEVFGIIVSTKPATKGVIAALGASKRPLVWICMEEHDLRAAMAQDSTGVDSTDDDTQSSGDDKAALDEEDSLETLQDDPAYGRVHGRIVQMLYNNAARQMGLEGLDVVRRYEPVSPGDMGVGDTIVLVYRGQSVRGHIATPDGHVPKDGD